jgi:hypothetical protein
MFVSKYLLVVSGLQVISGAPPCRRWFRNRLTESSNGKKHMRNILLVQSSPRKSESYSQRVADSLSFLVAFSIVSNRSFQ